MQEKDLEIKDSLIPGAGKGLFTKVDIPEGTRIVEYKGRRTTWKDVKDDDGKNKYIFFINNKNVIDASRNLKQLARYANDAKGIGRVKGLKNNAIYVIIGKKVYIESTRDIPAGTEILVEYGKDYWDVIRENIEIDRRLEKEKKKKARKKERKKQKKNKKH